MAAEVSYTPFDGASPVRTHHGAWLSEKDRRVEFKVSGTRDLVVVTLEGDHLYAVEREITGIYPNGITNRTELVGDLFKLRVHLIDSFGAILDDYEMMLVIDRKPGLEIELLSARYWVAFRLRELFQEGHNLLMKSYEIRSSIQEEILASYKAGNFEVATILEKEKEQETPVAIEAKEWEMRVGDFLGAHLSEEQKASFMNTQPSIDAGLNRVKKSPLQLVSLSGKKDEAPKNYWILTDSLKARWEKLSEIHSNY